MSSEKHLRHVSEAISMCVHIVLFPYYDSSSSNQQLPLLVIQAGQLFLTSRSITEVLALHMG